MIKSIRVDDSSHCPDFEVDLFLSCEWMKRVDEEQES